eukprot:SAG22_NODE_1772_length_3611_cov_11.428815_1_plen_357_part_10
MAGLTLDCLQTYSCLEARDTGCVDARSPVEVVTCDDIVGLDMCAESLGECNATCPGWCDAAVRVAVRCACLAGGGLRCSLAAPARSVPPTTHYYLFITYSRYLFKTTLRLRAPPAHTRFAVPWRRATVDVALVRSSAGVGPAAQLAALRSAAAQLLPGAASSMLTGAELRQLSRLQVRLFMNGDERIERPAATNATLCRFGQRLAAASASLGAAAAESEWQVRLLAANQTASPPDLLVEAALLTAAATVALPAGAAAWQAALWAAVPQYRVRQRSSLLKAVITAFPSVSLPFLTVPLRSHRTVAISRPPRPSRPACSPPRPIRPGGCWRWSGSADPGSPLRPRLPWRLRPQTCSPAA